MDTETDAVETGVMQPNADRKETSRVIMDLRIEYPPLAAVIAARCQFRFWSKVSPQRSTWKNVQGRIVFQPAPLFAGRSLRLAIAGGPFRISFQSARHGRLRNFDTEQPLSYCYELQLAETWKASPNLKTVADLQARPRTEIALISGTAGRCE